MNSPNSKLVPRHRAVPMEYYEKQIREQAKEFRELIHKVKELEDKIDKLQELVDQYEWAMGIGE